MRGTFRRALGAALLLAALAVGCGDGGGSAAAAPGQCIESWNASATSLRFGQHVYDAHESHRAQVAMREAAGGNPNVAAEGACAVVFAVPESDYEYGTVGLVVTDLGWAPMSELARGDPEALSAIQAEASGGANALLLPDGKLEAD